MTKPIYVVTLMVICAVGFAACAPNTPNGSAASNYWSQQQAIQGVGGGSGGGSGGGGGGGMGR